MNIFLHCLGGWYWILYYFYIIFKVILFQIISKVTIFPGRFQDLFIDATLKNCSLFQWSHIDSLHFLNCKQGALTAVQIIGITYLKNHSFVHHCYHGNHQHHHTDSIEAHIFHYHRKTSKSHTAKWGAHWMDLQHMPVDLEPASCHKDTHKLSESLARGSRNGCSLHWDLFLYYSS